MKAQCPHCSQKYNITEDYFGNVMQCQACGESIIFSEKDVIEEVVPNIATVQPKKSPQLLASPVTNQSMANRSLADFSPKKKSGGVWITMLILGGLVGAGVLFYKANNKEAEIVQVEVEKEDAPEKPVKIEPEPVVEQDKPKELSRRAKRRMARKQQEMLVNGEFETNIVPILERTCMSCHDELNEEGDLNLERFLIREEAEQQPDLWEKVAKVVSLNQMPPSDRKKQLTEEEKVTLYSWVDSLSARWDNGEMGEDPGKTIIHRLNKYEYSYTVRDLFGLKFWAAGDFPEDGSGESGFSNTADALFLPTLLAENYFEVAQKIVEAVYANRESKARYLISQPVSGKTPDKAAEEILTHWATYIYRTPVEKKELERLLQIFKTELKKTKNFSQAMQMPLFGMLISPQFLYRVTISEQQQSGVHVLNDFELASKLSYFLWSSMPDRELFRLAQKGELSNEEVLIAQTKRMLTDDRAKSLGKHLGGQWFGWEDLRSAVNPDEKKFPEFDFNLRVGLYQESSMFFNHLVNTDGSIYDLLDSDYTFLNDRLAKFYKLPAVEGTDLRLVKLDDKNRGGVLGMGSVLTSTSLALRSSPSNRGAYVLRDVLGINLPEPPMDVEPLPADDRNLGKLTVRESLEEHRTNPDCRSCHSEIDPIGFGLEAFDAIGRFRTHQNGEKIDVSGIMPDGTEFSSPAELKAALKKNKDLFARNAAEKFLTYALGRELSAFDRPTVKQISDEIIKNNGSIQTGIIEVVKSYPFRNYRGDNFQPNRPKITAK